MKKMSFLFMLMITSLVFSQNLITNGDFASGATGWTLDGGGAVVSGEAYFATSNATGNPWDTQLAQNGISFTAGATYTLTFKARAAANRNLTVAIQNVGSWDNQTANQVYALTPTMQTFTQTFNANTTGSNVNVAFLLGVQGATDAVYIDDVQLTGSVTPPPTVTPPSVAAPTPPVRLPSDVVSIYSNAYAPITIGNIDAGWCGSPAVTAIQISGNDTWQKASGAACHGIDFSSNRQNLSSFTHLHFDFYITDTDLTGDVFNVKLVQMNAAGTAEVSALEVNINGGTTPQLVANQWVSVDIPITSLGGIVAGNLTRDNIGQIGITTANVTNVWYDNIYLHKNTVLGTNEAQVKSDVRMYPNPVKAGETVTVDGKVKSLEVYNMAGQKVKNSVDNTVATDGLSKGFYIIKTTNEKGETQSFKLVIN
jgi:endoglucanase